jgi:hypothetical protein
LTWDILIAAVSKWSTCTLQNTSVSCLCQKHFHKTSLRFSLVRYNFYKTGSKGGSGFLAQTSDGNYKILIYFLYIAELLTKMC